MILLSCQSAVFISTPRSGSHSLFSLLVDHYGGRRVGLPPANIHPTEIPAEAAGWLVFTTCRNPYSRARSLWQWGTVLSQYAPQILREVGSPELEPFCEWLRGSRGRFRPTFSQADWHDRFSPGVVLRLEHLAEDGKALLPWWDPDAEIPHAMASPYPTGRAAFTAAAAEAVRLWAPRDFGRFGYCTHSWEALA